MKKIIQKSRFMLLLVAMMTLSLTNALAAETSYEELCTIKSADVVTTSSYTKYETTVEKRDWIITFGGNIKSVGTNSGNRSKCNLGSYTKYAVSPVTTSATASAFVSTTSISDVSKISYTFGGGSYQNSTKVYLIYSSDNTTFDTIPLTSGTQGATIQSGTAYEFAKCSGYFGLLFAATNSSGNWRIDDVNITFYKEKTTTQTVVTLKANEQGTADGAVTYTTGSATPDATPEPAWVSPSSSDYTLTGYYTAATDGVKVINADNSLNTDATDYVDADGKWKYAESSLTLYAQWQSASTDPHIYFDGTLNPFTYVEDNGPSEPQSIVVKGSNLTDDLVFIEFDDIAFEVKDEDMEDYQTTITLGSNVVMSENGVTIYVRMKEGLAADNYNDILIAYQEDVTSAQIELKGTVTELVAPSFTTQPVGASYEQGATPTDLSVVAEGNPAPTYQWYSNSTQSTEGATELTGATNATYTPSTATIGTTYYYCVATNSEGSATSNIVAVEVTEHVVTPGAYDIVPNNVFFNCDPFTQKPKDFTDATGSKNDVTVKYIAASNAYINASQCRMYSGTKMDFSVPEGYHIKAIAFTADGSNWAGTHTCDKGAMTDNKNWSGSTNKVTITFGGTCRCTSIKVTYAAIVKSVVSKATGIENGDVSASTTAGEITFGTTEVEEGAIVTLSNTPTTGYKLTEYTVYKTGDIETTVDVEDGAFTMPAFAVTVSATFEAAKVLTSVEITTPASKTEFWKGETFSSDGLVLTAHFDGANDSIVTPDSLVGYNMSAAGEQTVKVYYSEGVITKYAEYTITVKTIANTAATAYSVDSAIKLVQAGNDLATKVYVKGVITSISGQNLNNVFVKDAGLTNSFEFYGLADGSTYKVEDLVVSDTIIGYGEMTYYAKSGIYEFKSGCTLEDRKAYVEVPCAIENTLETAYTVAEAIALIDQGECLASAQVYVKGVVTSISGSNIYIKDADQSNSFEFYQIVDGGAAVTDVQLYDTTAAKGYLTKYQSTYEFTAGCTLEQIKTFVPHVLSVSLNSKAETIAANGSVQLSATVLPADAPDKSVTWSVIEGATYVSVDQTGLVSGLDAGAGSAKVRVTTTDGGFTDDCVITITAAETRKKAEGQATFSATSGALNNDIAYEAQKGKANNDPIIVSSTATKDAGTIRLYQNGGRIMFSAVKGCKIDQIIIKAGEEYESTTVAHSTSFATIPSSGGSAVAKNGEYNTNTGLNADTVYVVCLGTTNKARLDIAKITIYYTGEPLAIDTIKVSGDFQTEFEKGADFNHDGAIVTAYYSDQVTTAVVTNSATFSEPDMTTEGQKTVTVSYGGKSTSYQITILAATLDTLELSGTYQTIFQLNEPFNHTDMVVTAVYSDENKVDVTDEATFSAPDMTTAGQKEVTVSYGGKSTKYTISVKAQSGTMKKENVDFTVVYADVTSSKEVKGYSGVSFEMTCTTAGTNPTKYYANGNAVRSYTGNTIEFTAVDPIVFVNIKWAEGYVDDNVNIAYNEAEKKAVITFSKTCRFTAITVYYQYDEAIRTGMSVGQVGTGCLTKNVLAVRGGAFYNVEYGNTQQITFKEMQLPIAAGAPALFQAEAAKVEVIYGEEEATEAVEDPEDGFVGLLSGEKVAIPEGNILISGGRLRLVGENCWLTAGHAYIDMSEVSPTAPEAPARGRRLVLTNAEAQVVTGLNAAAIKDVEMQKVIMNGQMLIIREGKMYNAQGQMMK